MKTINRYAKAVFPQATFRKSQPRYHCDNFFSLLETLFKSQLYLYTLQFPKSAYYAYKDQWQQNEFFE